MDLFATAVRDVSELDALYEPSSALVLSKQIDHLDAGCRAHLSVCRFVVVSGAGADGRCDTTPRGGPAGFVARGHVGLDSLSLADAEQALVEAVTTKLV